MSKSTRAKLIIGVVLLLSVITVLLFYIVDKYSENKNMKDMSTYMTVASDEAWIILENGIYEEKAIIRNNELYVKYSLCTALFYDDFYVDAENDEFLYSIPGEVRTYIPNQSKVTVLGGKTIDLKTAPIIRENGELYVSLSFVADITPVKYTCLDNPKRVIINYQSADFLMYDVLEEAPLRFEASVKSEIVTYLDAEQSLFYLGGTGASSQSFVSVMTEDGLFGFVQKKYLSESYYSRQELVAPVVEESHILLDEAVKLGWHQISGKAGNDTFNSVTKNIGNMNVICPTWFRISSVNGEITSIGDKAYVEKAHEMGYDVWILIDNFDDNVSTLQTLSHRDSRRALIDNLINETKALECEGINIDFEAISRETGIHFVQFIKELSILAHKENLIVSVDNYVPSAYRAYYDLETQGKYADYIILMAYDEHYSGGEAGSVSSLSYVTNAITNAKKLVSDNQIVVGLPFYTRLWKLSGEKTSSEALSMKASLKHIAENDLETRWDEDTAQNYVEYILEGNTYKMWVEDKDSLEQKLNAVENGEVAGVAFWRIGFESEGTWELIDEIIK